MIADVGIVADHFLIEPRDDRGARAQLVLEESQQRIETVLDNLSEAGPEQFFQYDNRTSQRLVAPTSIKLGVTGQF